MIHKGEMPTPCWTSQDEPKKDSAGTNLSHKTQIPGSSELKVVLGTSRPCTQHENEHTRTDGAFH